MSDEWGLPHLTTDQLRGLVVALTNCLGRVYVEADPDFQKSVLENISKLREELRTSGRATPEILEGVARFRELLLGRRRILKD